MKAFPIGEGGPRRKAWWMRVWEQSPHDALQIKSQCSLTLIRRFAPPSPRGRLTARTVIFPVSFGFFAESLDKAPKMLFCH